MTTKPLRTDRLIILHRVDAEAALYRVAICAFTYYPDRPSSEPGYSVSEDVSWCTDPLRTLPAPVLARLRSAIAALITDPTADRRAFIATLARLVTA